MKKSVILLKHNSIIHEDREYDFHDLDDFEYMLKPNRKIIILEEELYLKDFFIDLKSSLLKGFVEEKIKDIFPQNGEVLYHYEKNLKENKVVIYSIKGRGKVEKLAQGTKEIEVIPLQFLIRETMKYILKKKKQSYASLIKYDDYYYYIECRNGDLCRNLISKDFSDIFKNVSKNGENGEIYIDNNIGEDTFFSKEFQIIRENIMGALNEKIYKK